MAMRKKVSSLRLGVKDDYVYTYIEVSKKEK